MSIFERIVGKKDAGENQPPRKPEQAVLVLLEGTGSPEKVYQQNDLAMMADTLKELIEREGLGQFGGNEFGPTETTLFMYGPDAERLFAGIEATLRSSPVCQGARVIIRRGGSGAEQKEVKL
jgi:hypothetical protein